MEETPKFSSFHMKKETNFEKALELLTSLISSSYSTQCFPLKWQLIRAKLEDLCSSLNHATISQNSDPSPFVQSLMSTLDEIQLVAVHSSDKSYNGGRLLLMSNLNKIISELDFHIKELSETFSPGVYLAYSHAIVPAKPANDARLDYIKFYIRDIFSRLTIASSDVKAQTLATLGEFLSEDERYVQILTQEIDDATEILVNLLESEDVGIKEEALGVVSVTAGFDSYKGYLARAGVMGPLVHALEKGGTLLGKERAVNALSKLTDNSENVWSFSAHGGVSAIVLNLNCSEDDIISSSELISSICVIMRNLMRVDEIKRFIVDEGAIRVLINLLNMKLLEENCKIRLVEFLGEIYCHDEMNKRKMVDESLIASLTELVDPNLPFCLKTREVSLKFIESLLPYFAPDAALVRCIIFYLKIEDSTIRESALKIMWKLCKVSDQYKCSIGESGALIELLQLVSAKSFQVREMAAETISNLASVNYVRQTFIQDENSLKELMRLLDPNESKSATTKFLLSALMSLAESNCGRIKIISSGHVGNVEKLAEFGESDAKNIMKKLSRNRLQSILSKIWSW
ncbi:vacuolar protein 8-like isoform X1 [Carex littledalei]|uniref:Vacuolar protein 8-like isoform X1 n=1 Tax=Carex littledalei TaxID=544730 RepID=A0A833R8P5_9POAL|nr:vacuolar protein 8-like isoform X1 [Carex littledalei]